MGSAKHFEKVQWGSRTAGKVLKGKTLGPVPVPVGNRWLKYRDVDNVPRETFRSWWAKNRED